MQWRKELKMLILEEKKRKYPASFEVDGGYTCGVKIPSEKKANGLTQLIIKFLTLKGHYANRISSQGQAHVHKVPRYSILTGQIQYSEKIQWTKGTTKRGTPDITAIINGRAVWIEVKIGKDRMSDDQKQEQSRILDAGGLYYIARDMQSFYDWYYHECANSL